MTFKHLLLITTIIIGSSIFAQKSYQKVYSLNFSGVVSDKKNRPLANVPIVITFKAEPISFSQATTDTITTDSLGKYAIKLEKKGLYKINYTGPKMISYCAEVLYNENLQNGLTKRIYEATLDVQLLPQTKKVKADIYNGGTWTTLTGELIFTEHKKYLQAHDYKVRKGFKSTKKLGRYVAKRVKKQQLPKILAVVSSRKEIDTVINSDIYYPEIRKRWQLLFGTNGDSNFDKQRLEYIQDFYAKISTKNEEGDLIYNYQKHSLDLTKTVKADDTKEVFQLYNFSFTNLNGKDISFDIMMIQTLTGWKVHYISENYR